MTVERTKRKYTYTENKILVLTTYKQYGQWY